MPSFNREAGMWVETTEEAAERLGLSYAQTMALVGKRKLASALVQGRRQIPSQSIDLYLHELGVPPAFSVGKALVASLPPEQAFVMARAEGFDWKRMEPLIDPVREELINARKAQEAAEASQGLSHDRTIVIPWDVRLTSSVSSRANIDSATSTTGGPFKFTQGGTFVDALRNKTALLRAGVRVVSNLAGPLSFPKENTQATAAWVAENPGSDASVSNLTTTAVTMSFKTIKAATSYTRQALFSAASGNYDLEAILRGDLAQVIGLAIDSAGLTGAGSATVPLGVLTDTAIGTNAAGTNGGALTAALAAQLVKDVATNKGDTDSTSARFLSNHSVEYYGRVNPKSASIPDPLLSDANALVGKPFVMSQQVPNNLTKGTSTTICSALIFGVWEYLTLGLFGAGLDIVADPYVGKLQNLITLDISAYADIGNRAPAAFKKITDLLA